MKCFLATLIASCLLFQLIAANITCNDRGVCTGSGSPAADTRCGGCHSCTYKNCCHACYGSLKSESAQKLKKVYDLRCEKYEFHSFNMLKCFDDIMMNQYEPYYPKCSDSLDFTKNDLVERRETLINGKECVLSISRRTVCSETARNYLRSRYDKFVNILTTKPEDEGCNSLYADLNKYQCSRMSNGMEEYWKKIKMGYAADIFISSGKDMCNNLEECSSDPCNIYPTSEQMEKCKIFDALGSKYKECTTYNRHSLGGCKDNDKKCLQKKMMEYCEGVED
ncbi:unnamed protein product [Caenorhabditis brenneri]